MMNFFEEELNSRDKIEKSEKFGKKCFQMPDLCAILLPLRMIVVEEVI